jgi:hypothetical protein
MKITPVQGTPTIAQPQSTGLSPEKIERLKTIARGEKPQEIAATEREHIKLGEVPTSAVRSIKMRVNRTPEQRLAQALVETAPGGDGPTPTDAGQAVISDTGVQETQENPAVEAKSPEVESTQQISPQLAALARRERALQVKEREFAEKQKAGGAESQKLASLTERAMNGQALSVLKELGIPEDQLYQRLTDEILGNKSAVKSDSLTPQEIQKILDERLAKKDSEQEQAVYDHMSKNIAILSRTRPEFRLIKESGSQGDVLDMIRRTWKETGEVLDEEEAMTSIEGILREDAKRFAKIMGELETPKVAPAPVAQTEQPHTARDNPSPRFRTLTNKDSARPVMSRRQRAIAAALGQK